eukprot:TRINITY_DN162_c0_g1_i2.p1 TRINITY_DN162_c0_g1~~TRINITY_DN162_c0_g1_i2.p1  ORF type:complete len:337 (-),score=34.15 TRINITY_DN162_c0_g1_i2:505-1515(-)
MTDLTISLCQFVSPFRQHTEILSFLHLNRQSSKLFASSFVCGAKTRPRFVCHGLTLKVWPQTQVAPKKAERKSVKDRDLRLVLEFATDAELIELCDILYGRSVTSPALKSFINRDDPQDILVQMDEPGERDILLGKLESRFLFLAGDAKATLTQCVPSYRDVLLQVRKKLGVLCSIKLSTEDIEAEIFLHLLQQRSSKSRNQLELSLKKLRTHFAGITSLPQARFQSQGQATAAIEELLSIILKGGKAVATKLENQLALLAARQGVARATLHYTIVKNLIAILGPLSWGTFLADLTIKAMGTDYARVVRAIYMFAQIRLTRTHGWAAPSYQLNHQH